MLIKLMLGARQFKKKPFIEMRDLFEQLSGGQNPETLFITCADSRIIPSLITQASPGDLFVMRNIGNIIPPYPSLSSEAGGIEYALSAFPIKDIIICGHSKCGAMNGLLTPDLAKRLPTVASWLSHSHAVLEKMHEDSTDMTKDPAAKLTIATEQNIILQMAHLKTYPLIAEKLARNELTIHGWLYEFESGKVHIYEPTANQFVSLETALDLAIKARKNKIISTIAMDYLEQLTHPKSASEYQFLMQLFSLMQNSIRPIWGGINTAVRHKLWEELGGFFSSPSDKAFATMVESGAQLQLKDLKQFQKNISESEGYRQYCGQLMRPSFFSQPKTQFIIPEELYTKVVESSSLGFR